MRRPFRVLTVLLALAVAGCSGGGGSSQAGEGPGDGSGGGQGGGGQGGRRAERDDPVRKGSGTVVVFAAASLAAPLEALAAEIEADGDVEVELNLAGSQQLIAQLQQGAPADVIATADPESMAAAREAGLTQGQTTTFAVNALTLVVRPGNPEKVRQLSDLARSGLRVAVASPEVPAGRYAQEAFAKAGVEVRPATEELSVKGVVTKVQLGEADAGVVYVTDARAAGDRLEAVAIPEEDNIRAEYQVARVAGAKNRGAARSFIDALRGAAGRKHLLDAGFVVD